MSEINLAQINFVDFKMEASEVKVNKEMLSL